MADKRMTEDEVVARLRSGMTIGIGGWGSRRKPMSLVRAIVRSSLADLTDRYGGRILPVALHVTDPDAAEAAVAAGTEAFGSLDPAPERGGGGGCGGGGRDGGGRGGRRRGGGGGCGCFGRCHGSRA